jgi:hypothetical protein
MRSIITEYHTAHHAEPLVVLPQLNLMYLKSDPANVYLIKTSNYDCPQRLLDVAIADGGDFCIQVWPSGRHVFNIFNADESRPFRCTAWTFNWDEKLQSLIKIQRYVRARYFQWKFKAHSRDPFGLNNITAFKTTTSATKSLPTEIVHLIVKAYVQSLHDLHHQHPIRSVKSDSFKKRSQHTFRNDCAATC